MKQKRIIASLLAGLSLSFSLQAQDLLIDNARVYTLADQGTLENADVLIRDGKIQRIAESINPPSNVQVIEANGRPLTPGLFAGISGIGLEEIGAEDATVDQFYETEVIRPEFSVNSAYNPNSSLVPINRIEGYTFTLLGAGASGSIVGGQGQTVLLDGGYQSFIGNPHLFVDVGSDSAFLTGNSRAAQWMILNQAIAEATSSQATTAQSLLTPAGRTALANYLGYNIVFFDVDRASDILATLRFAAANDITPVIVGGTEAWMVANELAEANVPVLLDPLVNSPSSFDQMGARLDNAALLNQAGVNVGIVMMGDNTHNARKIRQLAGNAVANGLPHEAGLAAITLNPANIIGVGDQIGSIERGKRADLVLWSDDPLEVTSVADQVIIDGEAVPMVSRQTKLRDRYLIRDPDMPRAYLKP